MSLKEAISAMREQLESLNKNLEKASGGNRTAAQRVRTGTITFARIAKVYRKESVAAEKSQTSKKAVSKTIVRKKKK